jgi:hypothetical protein
LVTNPALLDDDMRGLVTNPILDDEGMRGLVTNPALLDDDMRGLVTNPILDDAGMRGLVTDPSLLEGVRGPVSKADFGVPNLESLMGDYAGDYTPPLSLAKFDEETLNAYAKEIGGIAAGDSEESPIDRILMDVRTNTLPVEDAVTELVKVGLPEDAAVNIIIAHTEDFTPGIPGVMGS